MRVFSCITLVVVILHIKVIIKHITLQEPEVFSKIAQAAMQPLVTCYTPRIDTFIKQRQVTLDTKQEKLSKRKSIDELMEMSNLPQYNIAWGDKNNKEKEATWNMATIVWYFLK